MTCHGRSISSTVLVSCSMTGFSTDDPMELCIRANNCGLNEAAGATLREPSRGFPLMNLRLTQSKWRSTCATHNSFLDAFYLSGAVSRFVFVTAKMEKAMDEVEPQLVGQRSAELPGLAFCRLSADHDLA